MKQKVVIFDADGTIIDSIPAIYSGVTGVFAYCEVPCPSIETFILELEYPVVNFYRRYGVHLPEQEIYEILNAHKNGDATKVFEDARKFLSSLYLLGGFRLIVLTGNSIENIKHALDRANITRMFSDIISTGNKDVIASDLAKDSTYGRRTPFFGDMIADVVDAKKAGVTPIAVLRGTHVSLARHFFQAGAQAVIQSFDTMVVP